MSRRGGRRRNAKRIVNVSAGILRVVDKVAQLRADQIKEGRRMMAAEKKEITQ